MKSNTSILSAVAGSLILLSSVAIADTSSTISPALGLEKMIQAKAEQNLAAEANNFAQIAALAGDRQEELAKRKSEVARAYKTWHDIKSDVEASHNKANISDFKAVEAAAQVYSQANKAFIDLQKDILAKNGFPFDAVIALNASGAQVVAVNALNATAPTAAGSR